MIYEHANMQWRILVSRKHTFKNTPTWSTWRSDTLPATTLLGSRRITWRPTFTPLWVCKIAQLYNIILKDTLHIRISYRHMYMIKNISSIKKSMPILKNVLKILTIFLDQLLSAVFSHGQRLPPSTHKDAPARKSVQKLCWLLWNVKSNWK